MPAREQERERPPFWRRFDVRTSLLFGAPIVLLLVVLAVSSYQRGVDAEVGVLQARLRATAVGLSHTIDHEAVASLRDRSDQGSPSHRALVDLFARVARPQREVVSIYVLCPTERRGWLRFAADWVRSGRPGEVGELYDGTQADRMLEAFSGPVVESRIYSDAWGENLSGYAPIRDESGRAIAIVGVDINASSVDARKRSTLRFTAQLIGAALLLFALGGALIGRAVQRPIERIIEATGAIAAGESNVRIGIHRSDELGILAQRIDRMAEQLDQRERIRAMFGRYVSADVARRVLAAQDGADQKGVERDVTVLFSDIRGYSTISESLGPNEVVDMLNHYFSAMTDLVDEHGGCVIELFGDAILAVFGAPEAMEDHPARALRCALAMRARLRELNDEWEESGLARLWKSRGVERLEARIGAHSGNVVAGTLSSRRRTKYTLLGATVNIAKRLEALNEELGTSILVSAELFARLDGELSARAEDGGEHPLKGKSAPMRVYAF